MAEKSAAKHEGRRNTKLGEVVSTMMSKTIVVQVTRQKRHPLYVRVVKRSKKFYAHDEQNQCRVGDVVRIVESRPLSRLKRWRLAEVLRRAKGVGLAESADIPAAGAGPDPTGTEG